MNEYTKTFSLLPICLLILSGCGFSIIDSSVPTSSSLSEAPTQTTVPLLPTETPLSFPTRVVDTLVLTSPLLGGVPTQDIVPLDPTETPSLTPTQEVTGSLARQHLVAISEEIGPRLPGSPEEADAAEYIAAAFEDYGYVPQVQSFSFTTEDEKGLYSANVIAVKPGLSPREIIVGAHYDSTDDGKGADDNASGVATLLEVAALLHSSQPSFTIRLIAFGAEEEDLNGSRYYVEQMEQADIQNTIGMINLDSLIAGDITYVYGDAGAGTLRDWIFKRAQDAGFVLEGRTAQELDEPDGTPCECADYSPFQAAGIPFAYFEATNWNLGEDAMTQVNPKFGKEGVIRHTEYDNIEYLDAMFPNRIDQHLNEFITLLYDTSVQFKASN